MPNKKTREEYIEHVNKVHIEKLKHYVVIKSV